MVAITCDWSDPGVDPYTGTARAAIERMVTIPAPVRQVLIARAERDEYDDVVMIDRDTIRSPAHEYRPEITSMAFGGRGRVCATVSRAGWDARHVESAMVFCAGGYCIARPSVCNNWSIVQRLESSAAPAVVEPVAGDRQVAVASPLALSYSTPSASVFIPTLTLPPAGSSAPWRDVAPIYFSPAFEPPTLRVPPPMAAVPEPSTWMLFLAGAAAIGLRLRRSKQLVR